VQVSLPYTHTCVKSHNIISLTSASLLVIPTLASNNAQFVNTGIMSTVYNSYITSTISVSGFSGDTMNSNYMVSITLSLVHSNPQNLEIYVVDPSGTYGAVLGYKSSGSTVPCSTYYSTTFADSQTYQNVYSGTSSGIPCPPSTVTAIGSYWYDSGITSGSLGNTPFASAYATDNIDGNWVLNIKDTVSGSTGTLYGWAINIYSEMNFLFFHFSFFIFPPLSNTNKLILLAGCTNNPCGSLGSCNANGASYTCTCIAGYQMSGGVCVGMSNIWTSCR